MPVANRFATGKVIVPFASPPACRPRRACDTYGGKGPFMVYGASVRQQDPTAYAPDQVMGIVIDEYVNHVLKRGMAA